MIPPNVEYRNSVNRIKDDPRAEQEASEQLESIRKRHKRGKISKRGLPPSVIDLLRFKLSRRCVDGREQR